LHPFGQDQGFILLQEYARSPIYVEIDFALELSVGWGHPYENCERLRNIPRNKELCPLALLNGISILTHEKAVSGQYEQNEWDPLI
jgi:hypothetical protein